jgi:pilus assembly protein CpaE
VFVKHAPGPAGKGEPDADAPAHFPLGDIQVVLFEEDPLILDQLYQAVPEAWGAQAFSTLDDADGTHFRPEAVLVLVLGPSQASDVTLGRVSGLLKSTPGSGAVLIIETPSADVMRLALRAGVHDALELSTAASQLPAALAELADRLHADLADAEARRDQATLTGPSKGMVTSVFSPKGGVGKSVIAVNLAAALARRTGEPVVILDLDLQFGDVAVMLRLQPRHTFSDAVSAGDLLDETLLGSFLARHEKSGVYVLSAPTSPSEADQVDPTVMLRVLHLLKEMFAYVVIDTPPHLSEVVLQAVAASDAVAFVVAMDVPSVKNARLGLQAFELLQLPLGKVLLLLNRADSRVYLANDDIERVLEMKVDLAFPSEATVPQSVNQGVPALIEYPRSRFSNQVYQLADLVLARAEVPSGAVASQKR